MANSMAEFEGGRVEKPFFIVRHNDNPPVYSGFDAVAAGVAQAGLRGEGKRTILITQVRTIFDGE